MLLERQLIYTAITRAKKLLIIIGQQQALAYAIKTQNSVKRNSMLIEKIKETTNNENSNE
jgi:exodeoxyribonuclease V alpha subunit